MEIPDLQPHALVALTFDPWARARSRDIQVLITYGLAADALKRAVAPPRNGWAPTTSSGNPATSCGPTASSPAWPKPPSAPPGSLYIQAELDAIFLGARQRGRGLCRLFCEMIADSLYRQILSVIIRSPIEQRRSIHITVSADLYSKGARLPSPSFATSYVRSWRASGRSSRIPRD